MKNKNKRIKPNQSSFYFEDFIETNKKNFNFKKINFFMIEFILDYFFIFFINFYI